MHDYLEFMKFTNLKISKILSPVSLGYFIILYGNDLGAI